MGNRVRLGKSLKILPPASPAMTGSQPAPTLGAQQPLAVAGAHATPGPPGQAGGSLWVDQHTGGPVLGPTWLGPNYLPSSWLVGLLTATHQGQTLPLPPASHSLLAPSS